MGLTEADLPVLLKLCEHFENSDTDDRFYDEMFLNKLYENNGGIVKGMIYE